MDETLTIKFNEASVGDYLMSLDLCYAFEVVSKVIDDEMLLQLRCCKISRFVKKPSYKENQIIIDYFNSDYYWANKRTVEDFFSRLENDFNSR